MNRTGLTAEGTVLKARDSVDYAAEGAEYYKKYMEGLII